jgi:hypothetical protein
MLPQYVTLGFLRVAWIWQYRLWQWTLGNCQKSCHHVHSKAFLTEAELWAIAESQLPKFSTAIFMFPVLTEWASLYIVVITMWTEAYCCRQSQFSSAWIGCVVSRIQNKFERSFTYSLFETRYSVNHSQAVPGVFIREMESAICWRVVHKVWTKSCFGIFWTTDKRAGNGTRVVESTFPCKSTQIEDLTLSCSCRKDPLLENQM